MGYEGLLSKEAMQSALMEAISMEVKKADGVEIVATTRYDLGAFRKAIEATVPVN